MKDFTGDGLHPWAKAGLMLRDSLHKKSEHFSIFVTGNSGLQTVSRAAHGHRATEWSTMPEKEYCPPFFETCMSYGSQSKPRGVWLLIAKTGDTVQAYYKWQYPYSPSNYIKLGQAKTVSFSGTFSYGIAVTSHDTTKVAKLSGSSFKLSHKLANGESCSKSPECISDLCDRGFCIDKLANGQNCYKSPQCMSGKCFNGSCSGRLTNGQFCYRNSQCISGLCFNGSCESKRFNGQSCFYNSQCYSGYCKRYWYGARKCSYNALSTPGLVSLSDNTLSTPSLDTESCFPNVRNVKLRLLNSVNDIRAFDFHVTSLGVNVADGEEVSKSLLNNQTFEASTEAERDLITSSLQESLGLEVDLGQGYSVDSVAILGRWCMDSSDPDCLCKLNGATLILVDDSGEEITSIDIGNDACGKSMLEYVFDAAPEFCVHEVCTCDSIDINPYMDWMCSC